MEVLVSKNCHVCGIDLRQRRRTKDPRGRYFCKPCWHGLLAEYYARKGADASTRTAAQPPPRAAAPPPVAVAPAAPPPIADPPIAMPKVSAPSAWDIESTSAGRPFPHWLIPFAVCIPAAMCFATNPSVRIAGITSMIAIASVVVLALACLDRARGQPAWANVILATLRVVMRDLLEHGARVLLFAGLAGAGILFASNGAGVGGAICVAMAFLVIATRELARSAGDAHSANSTGTDPAASADDAAEAVNANDPPIAPGATVLALRPSGAIESADRPNCRPIFQRPVKALELSRGSSDFRTSDLLTALACEVRPGSASQPDDDHNPDDESPIDDAPLPLRLRVDVQSVRSARAQNDLDDASSDSSVGGYRPARMQSYDSSKRAWA